MTDTTHQQPHSLPAITTLLKVKRDGNPLREHGHVSPLIGKLGPIDPRALDRFAATAIRRLPRLEGPTLIIGLTESSLVLAWWLAKRIPHASLVFSTREGAGKPGARCFKEPHSHAPDQFIIPPAQRFREVLIVEDEITTGATLKNLILSLADLCDRFVILTMSDLREGTNQGGMEREGAENHLNVSVIDLSDGPEATSLFAEEKKPFLFNPFGREQDDIASLLDEFRKSEKLGMIYAIGECLDLPLAFLEERPSPMQHVTRSPWLVDGEAIHSRIDFEGSPRYFLYNWEKPDPPSALIVGNENDSGIAEGLRLFLEHNGVNAIVRCAR